MDHRPALRRRTALALTGLVLLLAGCSNEQSRYPHQLDQPTDGWTQGSVARTVLLYLVLPVGLAVVISVLSLIPSARRRNRYRPQEGWNAEPVWFAGPPDPVAALEQADTGDVVRGGAGGSW